MEQTFKIESRIKIQLDFPQRTSNNSALVRPKYHSGVIELKENDSSDSLKNDNKLKIRPFLAETEKEEPNDPVNESKSLCMRQSSHSFQVLPYDSPARKRNEDPTVSCRICLMEENEEDPMVIKCMCKGTVGKMHKSCLIKYIKLKLFQNKEVKCDVCNEKIAYSSKEVREFRSKSLISNISSFLCKHMFFTTLTGSILLLIYYMFSL